MARICGKIYVFCKIYTPRIYFAGPAAINTCVHYIGLILISKKYRWNWLSSIYMYYTDREFRRRRSSTVDIVFFYETFFGIEFSEHIISRILLFWIYYSSLMTLLRNMSLFSFNLVTIDDRLIHQNFLYDGVISQRKFWYSTVCLEKRLTIAVVVKSTEFIIHCGNL